MHPHCIIAALFIVMLLLDFLVVDELLLYLQLLIMSAPVTISSREQFSNIISTTAIVVADCESSFVLSPSHLPRRIPPGGFKYQSRIDSPKSTQTGVDHARPLPQPTISCLDSCRVRTGSPSLRSMSMSSRRLLRLMAFPREYTYHHTHFKRK